MDNPLKVEFNSKFIYEKLDEWIDDTLAMIQQGRIDRVNESLEVLKRICERKIKELE